MPRLYKGFWVYFYDTNSMGMKYYSRMTNGDLLKADTLKGIKQLINQHLVEFKG